MTRNLRTVISLTDSTNCTDRMINKRTVTVRVYWTTQHSGSLQGRDISQNVRSHALGFTVFYINFKGVSSASKRNTNQKYKNTGNLLLDKFHSHDPKSSVIRHDSSI